MKQEPFGFFAPRAPSPKKIPAVDWLLADLTKTEICAEESDQLDPVGSFMEKAALKRQMKDLTTGGGEFDLLKALSETDSRDRELVTTTLRKDVSIPDWSWSSPASDTLEKRHETLRERFDRQLQEFCGDHHAEELAEVRAVVRQALADERSAMLSEV